MFSASRVRLTALASASAMRARLTTSADCLRPRLSRYCTSSLTFWIFIVSRASPSLPRSMSASSSSFSAKAILSLLTSSGVSWLSTPRRLPSRVSLAIWMMILRSMVRKRSMALPSAGSWLAILRLATPCTLSGMPPLE